MRKVFARHVENLEAMCTVRTMSARDLMGQLVELRRWSPDIMHYLAGPSTRGLLAVTLAGRVLRSTAVILSLIHPELGPVGRRLLSRGRFDAVLGGASTLRLFDSFRSASYVFTESGVDTRIFSPVDVDQKLVIRRRLGLPADARIVLHVGHIKAGRNLAPLRGLTTVGFHVAVVGSSRPGWEVGEMQALKDAGCRVTIDYQPEIQQWYQAADCYVFPTIDPGNAIQLPLSILEALAVGLPVVSSDFGSVTDFLGHNPCVKVIEEIDSETLGAAVSDVLRDTPTASGFAVEFDWGRRTAELLEVYRRVSSRA